MSIVKIRKAVEAAKGNARQMGEVVLMIAEADRHAAEVIAADLDNPEMSFDKCFGALYEYAKKHQKNNSWSCGGYDIDLDNPIIKVICDFYKIPAEVFGAETQTLGTENQDAQQADELDLMSLL